MKLPKFHHALAIAHGLFFVQGYLAYIFDGIVFSDLLLLHFIVGPTCVALLRLAHRTAKREQRTLQILASCFVLVLLTVIPLKAFNVALSGRDEFAGVLALTESFLGIIAIDLAGFSAE